MGVRISTYEFRKGLKHWAEAVPWKLCHLAWLQRCPGVWLSPCCLTRKSERPAKNNPLHRKFVCLFSKAKLQTPTVCRLVLQHWWGQPLASSHGKEKEGRFCPLSLHLVQNVSSQPLAFPPLADFFLCSDHGYLPFMLSGLLRNFLFNYPTKLFAPLHSCHSVTSSGFLPSKHWTHIGNDLVCLLTQALLHRNELHKSRKPSLCTLYQANITQYYLTCTRLSTYQPKWPNQVSDFIISESMKI